MFVAPLVIYLLLCVLVGYRGRDTRLGSFGCFLASVVLTPVLVFVILLLIEPAGFQSQK
ncbi:hypothetical protein [Roseibium aggregatum]|uniref:hypothetical protein n=1 Tax=Roseibium aggregatum TaxID=187304 RepID=UPI0025AC3FDC|nr:hypothetical protein [Roseibium aggregatum]WJS00918.1 hypothetical protein QUB73_17290 [Roseibium aggregatum]